MAPCCRCPAATPCCNTLLQHCPTALSLARTLARTPLARHLHTALAHRQATHHLSPFSLARPSVRASRHSSPSISPPLFLPPSLDQSHSHAHTISLPPPVSLSLSRALSRCRQAKRRTRYTRSWLRRRESSLPALSTCKKSFRRAQRRWSIFVSSCAGFSRSCRVCVRVCVRA